MVPAIEVNQVWKEYQKGVDRKYKSLRDAVIQLPKELFGNGKEKFWALQDINFTVNKGESIGIIGRNGAGKSTLLKILSRITPPTKGSITLRGRVASLLEVGTGFHPELTGRENIYFNGSILGMKHTEVKRKFDEIVDFSGVESFIDTPLKHYSSGMQMRLAFSVAAHLDAEILLIDEVLAVGDAEFQKKCIGKMGEVSKGEGKTILFVSHDMKSINLLAKDSFLLDRGIITRFGTSNEIINFYYERVNLSSDFFDKTKTTIGDLCIKSCQIKNESKNQNLEIKTGNPFEIEITIENNTKKVIENVVIGILVKNIQGNVITALRSDLDGHQYNMFVGPNIVCCHIPKLPLTAGIYTYNIIVKKGVNDYDWIKDAGKFNVLAGRYYKTLNVPAPNYQIALIDHHWL